MKIFWFLAAIMMSFFIGRFSINQAPISSASDGIKLFSEQQPLLHKTESSELVQTNLKLETEINQLKQQLLRQQQSAIPNAKISTEQKTELQNNPIDTNHVLEDAQEFTKQLTADNNNFFQQVNEKFNQEPVDQSWATQQQHRIDQWLKGTKELENFSIEGITCKTTNCKITFPINSTENSNELTQIISQASKQSGGIINNSIIYDHSVAGSLSLYVAR